MRPMGLKYGRSSMGDVLSRRGWFSVALIVAALAPVAAAPANASSWTLNALPAAPSDGGAPVPLDVSCAGVSLCVAVGDGAVWTTTDPAAGSSAWAVGGVQHDLLAVACPSEGVCLATGDDLVSYTASPATGAASWRSFEAAANGPGGIACATMRLCVRPGGAFPLILTSRRPTSRASWKWSRAVSNAATWQDVACPSTRLCIAVDRLGYAATSTHPGRRHATWRLRRVAAQSGRGRGVRNSLSAVACPSKRTCVAANTDGQIYAKRNPARAGHWRTYRLQGASGAALRTSLACARRGACVLADPSGDVFVSGKPLAGASSWSRSHLGDIRFTGVSCPTKTFCAAVGYQLNGGPVVATGNPLG